MKNVQFLLVIVSIFINTTITNAQKMSVLSNFSLPRDARFNDDERKAVYGVGEPTCRMPTTLLGFEPAVGQYWTGERDANGKQIIKDTCCITYPSQTWEYFGESFVANALYNIKTYSPLDKEIHTACVGYVVSFANINEVFSNTFSYSKDSNNLTRKTITTILKDKSYHLGVYQWLKPSLISAWNTLDKKYQNFYHKLITYVKTFDYASEKKYYETLKKNNQLNKFTSYEPNGEYDLRRKAKAWVFRRIYFDGWDYQYVLKWVKTFETEITV